MFNGRNNMKIQILSDLHLEFFKKDKSRFLFIEGLVPNEKVDVLVLAGDIVTKGNLQNSIKTICDNWNQVVYVAGNHEYYNSNFEEINGSLCNVNMSNFHVLNDSCVNIEGQNFIGSTLWFPDGPYNYSYSRSLNDFNRIEYFRDKVYNTNTNSVSFLKDNVSSDDIVLTHHLPLEESVSNQYKNDPFNCFFLCDMSDVISDKEPKLWIHGHTHGSFDYKKDNTRVVCNPYGYVNMDENPDFIKHLIIDTDGE
jgi:Icc-related predicted phosphoesterase